LLLPTGDLRDAVFIGMILRIGDEAKVLTLRATDIKDPNQP
jgi:hypothetical protein